MCTRNISSKVSFYSRTTFLGGLNKISVVFYSHGILIYTLFVLYFYSSLHLYMATLHLRIMMLHCSNCEEHLFAFLCNSGQE